MNFSSKQEDFEKEIIETIFGEVLIKKGYSIRESQIQMVQDILKLMQTKKKYLVCEAEVGTGKSFAYLIPLLAKQKSKHFGFSVVISTATISLQEQILKDVNLLIDLLNLDTQVILSKGSTHFLCRKRLNDYFPSTSTPEWMGKWKIISPYGDRVELLQYDSSIKEYWNKINVQKCSFTNCNYYNDCPYIKLRSELRERNKFIITNHDQLISHAQKVNSDENPIFSEDIQYIVLDEAHNLEDKAFNALTQDFSKKTILSTLRIIETHLSRSFIYSEIQPKLEKFETLITLFFENLEIHFETEYQKSEYKHDTSRIHIPSNKTLSIKPIISLIKHINDTLDINERGRRTREHILNAQRTFEQLAMFLVDLEQNNKIFWLEKLHKAVHIWSVPKEISDILRNRFFNLSLPSFILTSGTITQGQGEDLFEKYMYFLADIGMDMVSNKELLLSEPKLSPYSYKESTMLYISQNLPNPSKQRQLFREQSIEELIKIIRLTDGRAMILFTSKDDMRYVETEFAQRDLPWTILVQDNESSQQEIIQEFKTDEKSVLLSTGIFWEGIDIKGAALSNLIIYRLPFPTPDPVLDYKKEQAYSHDEYLNDILLPKMIVKLRQGLGRLIRSETDRGIACILDPRLSSKMEYDYKKTVFDTLHFGKITEDFQELTEFTKSIGFSPKIQINSK